MVSAKQLPAYLFAPHTGHHPNRTYLPCLCKAQLVITYKLEDQIKACMQGPPAQDSKQPERNASFPTTELDPLYNETQAADSKISSGAACKQDASGRLHSSSRSQTAASKHSASSMPQKEEVEDLLSSGTDQTGSGAFSGTTLHPTEPTAVVSSISQADKSVSLPGGALHTAVATCLLMPLPLSAEMVASQHPQPDMVHHSTQRTEDSGTLVSVTAHTDVVPASESSTAGAGTMSSSATQTSAPGTRPDSAKQTADALPSSAPETATIGILPHDTPKIVQSLPSSAPAAASSDLLASSNAHSAVSDTLPNTTAQIESLRTHLGSSGTQPAGIINKPAGIATEAAGILNKPAGITRNSAI